MTISTEADLINARANKRQDFPVAQTSIANAVAGTLHSLYRSTGPTPVQPAIPAANAVPTKALTFNFNNPGGADKTYVDMMDLIGTIAGEVTLFDRLFHMGGLSGTVTTAQNVNSNTALTFPARGAAAANACEWFLEWYTDTGATGVNATVAVTHTDATTANIVIALSATTRAGRLYPIVSPGKVISQINTVTLSATTGTAGNFGVTCGRRIAGTSMGIVAANVPAQPREAILEEIPNDACLWRVMHCSTTSTGDQRGSFTLVQG